MAKFGQPGDFPNYLIRSLILYVRFEYFTFRHFRGAGACPYCADALTLLVS